MKHLTDGVIGNGNMVVAQAYTHVFLTCDFNRPFCDPLCVCVCVCADVCVSAGKAGLV